MFSGQRGAIPRVGQYQDQAGEGSGTVPVSGTDQEDRLPATRALRTGDQESGTTD